MGKRWIFALTVAVVLGLIGLLAYTSESVHRVAEPPPISTEAARPTRRAGVPPSVRSAPPSTVPG